MRSRMSRFVLASVVVFAATESWGQVAEHPVLLALSKTNHTLSIVDPVTLTVIAKMPVGPDPHEVIASADGTRAWVSNMQNSQGHELNVLDLVNYNAAWTPQDRNIRGQFNGVAWWPDTSRAVTPMS